MNRLAAIAIGLHTRLLRLYPKSYREEFGEERITVFDLAVSDAAQRGALAVLHLALRELRDLPRAIVSEHLRQRKKVDVTTSIGEPHATERATWGEALAGAAPLFIFGLITVLREALSLSLWPGDRGAMNLIIVYLALLAGSAWAGSKVSRAGRTPTPGSFCSSPGTGWTRRRRGL
jgi:hypothetical protein